MRGILIDPYTKTIEYHDHNGKLEGILAAIQVENITTVRYDRDHIMYLDDFGLYVPDQRYFMLDTYTQPLGGRALLSRATWDGEEAPVTVDVKQVKARISWVRPDLRFTGADQSEGETEHPAFGKLKSITIRPKFDTGKE